MSLGVDYMILRLMILGCNPQKPHTDYVQKGWLSAVFKSYVGKRQFTLLSVTDRANP